MIRAAKCTLDILPALRQKAFYLKKEVCQNAPDDFFRHGLRGMHGFTLSFFSVSV